MKDLPNKRFDVFFRKKYDYAIYAVSGLLFFGLEIYLHVIANKLVPISVPLFILLLGSWFGSNIFCRYLGNKRVQYVGGISGASQWLQRHKTSVTSIYCVFFAAICMIRVYLVRDVPYEMVMPFGFFLMIRWRFGNPRIPYVFGDFIMVCLFTVFPFPVAV